MYLTTVETKLMADNPVRGRGRPPIKTPEQRKADRAEYMRNYYNANKDKMKENAARAYQKQQEFIAAAHAAGVQVNRQ